MQTKLIMWAQTPHDTRDTASTCVTFFHSGKRSAVSVARDLDFGGKSSADELLVSGDLLTCSSRENVREATHHGVTVVYPTGRTRTVRASRS